MRKAICTPNEDESEINRKQRRIQDFPDGGGLQPQGGGGTPTYYLVKFLTKLLENEVNWTG